MEKLRMNETIGYNITGTMSRAFYNTSASNEGLTESVAFVIGKIFEVLTDTGKNYGFWKFLVVLFAIVGFFSVISAIGTKIIDGFGIIFKFCVIIPIIIIIGLINKKKREERKKELKWLKEDFKKNSKIIPKRYWALWSATKIVLPLALLAYIIWRIFY